MADHDRGSCIVSSIFGGKGAAYGRLDAQQRKEARTDELRADPFRLSSARDGAGLRIHYGSLHLLKRAATPLQFHQRRELRVPPVIFFGISLFHQHQPVSFLEGEGAEHQHVDRTEDRRVGPDPEGQREHGGRDESRVLQKHPEAIAYIPKQVSHRSASAGS